MRFLNEKLILIEISLKFAPKGPIDNNPAYRKISDIRRTQNQNLNDSRLIMQLPLPNPLKPGVKSRMKM